MPQNCSNDVSLVVNYIDNVLTHGSAKEKQSLKDQFGFGPLQDDDFASALENGPWLWQSNQFYTGYSAFYEFCDYVEDAVGSTGPTPSAKGVGLQKALAGYADWSKNVLIPGCTLLAFVILYSSHSQLSMLAITHTLYSCRLRRLRLFRLEFQQLTRLF